MNNNKTAQTLTTFTKKETAEFLKWINAPFFNQRKDVCLLAQHLTLQLSGKNPPMDRPTLFLAIYANEPYHDQKLNHLYAYLFKVVKKYLAWKELEADGEQEELYVTRALRKRKLAAIFETQWKSTAKNLAKSPHKNALYHWQQAQLQREWFEYSSPQERISTEGLQASSDHLLTFFIASQIEFASAGLIYQQLGSADFKVPFLKHVLQFLEEQPATLSTPVILMNHAIYQAFSNTTKEHNDHIFLLIETLQSNAIYFNKNELKNYYLATLNLCIRQLNNNQEEFKEVIFNLFKKGLEQEVFMEDGQISRFTFTNIVKTALGNKAFDWAAEFIETYQFAIEKPYQESIYQYNQLLLFNSQGDYQNTIARYGQFQLDDLLYNLDSRRILLKIYFELKEWSALNSLLDSFYSFLYRQKKLKYHRTHYLNLVKYCRKIIHIPSYKEDARQRVLEYV